MKKIALITGASKGIGKTLTERMLREGFFVIGTSRGGVIKEFTGKDFYALELDLSNKVSIEQANKEIWNKFNRIDMLINNAGIGPDLDSFLPENVSFNQTFNVNVNGTVFFTEGLIGLLPKNSIIINISSKMGAIGVCERSDSVAYRMSKSALNMYSKILSNRLKFNVRVASIHPGWVKTNITPNNMINGRLTPEESVENIYEFITSDFKNGTFWDAEEGTELPW